MSSLKNPEDKDEATRVINAYAKSDWCNFEYSEHALERQAQRVIPIDVITIALQSGAVVSIESEIVTTRSGKTFKRWAYEVEWRDKYGRVTVVTAIPGLHKLKIITAYTDIPD